jgi:hypothetical protein
MIAKRLSQSAGCATDHIVRSVWTKRGSVCRVKRRPNFLVVERSFLRRFGLVFSHSFSHGQGMGFHVLSGSDGEKGQSGDRKSDLLGRRKDLVSVSIYDRWAMVVNDKRLGNIPQSGR